MLTYNWMFIIGQLYLVSGCTDVPGTVVNAYTCETLIGNFSTYCYSHIGGAYNTTCCASCAKAKTCDENCLYGDMRLDCAGADCTVPFNKVFCCSTCPSPNSVTCITTTEQTTTIPSTTTTSPTTTTTTPSTTTTTTTAQTATSETTSTTAPQTTSSTTMETPTTSSRTTTQITPTTTTETTAYVSTTTPTPILRVGDSDTLLSAASAGTLSDSASIGMYATIGGFGLVGLILSSIAIAVYLKRPKRTNSQVGVTLTNNWVG